MRIMIVDDEIHALNNLKECLNVVEPNAEILPFDRSDNALSFAREGGAFEIAFLDINMAVINGVELAKELKKLNPTLNVIFCTAYSGYAVEAIRLHASGYVTKPYTTEDIEREIANLLHPVSPKMPRIFARTFGDFDLFVNGVAITFKRSKSKELLAYLIYKRGGLVSKKELAAVLLSDDYSNKAQNYISKIYGDLASDLKSVDAASLLHKGFNQYGIDARQISCDYYDYLDGIPSAINAYSGDFMTQYDWAMV